MKVSLKNYTLQYLAATFLLIIAVWAALFYTFIIEEIYDNVDDGLKNQKIQIIKDSYTDESILKVREFDFKQFRITPIDATNYKEGNYFRNQLFYMEYEDDYEPYRILETFFWDKNGKPNRLEIRTSTVEEDEFIENLLFALLMLYLIIVASIILINNLLLKKTWKPFYQILQNLSNYQSGEKTTQQVCNTPIEEFQLLSDEIDKMIKRNEQGFLQQKQFIENVAHELQTPIAVCINKIELLLSDENTTKEISEGLNVIHHTLFRLANLNKSLLMLSKIENRQFQLKEQLNFNNLCFQIIENFSHVLQYKEIQVLTNEIDVFLAEINKDLGFILLSNLVQNAVRHTPKKGKIEICISQSNFKISNTAVNNQPLDKNKIFDRFYKATSDSTSTGLGLAIIKSIIDTSADLEISYTFEKRKHVFEIVKK